MGYVTQKTTVFPITYPIGEAYVRTLFPTMEERDIEIVCTLRENNGDRTRGRVKSWVNEYARNTGLSNIKAQEINHASRTTIDTAYFNQMFRARIIVTVNPAGWEGGNFNLFFYNYIIFYCIIFILYCIVFYCVLFNYLHTMYTYIK